jgi:hypothetical protein
VEAALPMKNFTEELGINGHLEIIKRMKTGEEEVLLDDANIIVSGMGVGLSYLFTASGSNTILDYQIQKFQVGVSGPPAGGIVSSINELSGALSSIDEYGQGSNLALETADQIVGASLTNRAFAAIPASKMTRINPNSVRYTLVLDEEAANGIQRDGQDKGINEIGMFMKNPTGNVGGDRPILVCYRTFSDIVKTNDFSLIFRWTINF